MMNIKGWLKTNTATYVACGISLFGALLLTASFYIKFWLLEILVSQALVVAVVLAVSYIFTILLTLHNNDTSDKYKYAKVGYRVGMVGLLFVVMANLYVSSPSTIRTTNDDQFSLVFGSFNRLLTNSEDQLAIDYLKETQLDIVVLQEVTQDKLDLYKDELSYNYAELATDGLSAGSSSVGILSDFLVVESSTVRLSPNMGALRAVLTLPGSDEQFVVYSVHVWPPTTPSIYSEGNNALDQLASSINNETTPVLVGGDFNTTAYSPVFDDFLDNVSDKVTLISESRLPQCSWYGGKMNIPLCMRIDHMLVSAEFSPADVQISPSVGSDHRIISSQLSF